MSEANIKAICGSIVFGALLWAGPSAAVQVDCDKDPPGALQRAIDAADPHASIQVRGTCNENVTIPQGKEESTLDGGGKATIHGPDSTAPTIMIKARGTTIQGLTVTGGADGIHVNRTADAVIVKNYISNTFLTGIYVQSGQAWIDGNTMQRTGRRGIVVNQSGFATIVNNAILNNPDTGIIVAGNAFALIGTLNAPGEMVASPNTIQKNGGQGIHVFRSADAVIVGNDISDNTLNGIFVQKGGRCDIADNTINGNGRNGIHVVGGVGVNLGEDTGDTFLTRPNRTTSNNAGFGIRCEVGGYADGRLGTLSGDSGAQSYSEGCIGSLISPK